MAQPRQRVVFGQDPDPGARAASAASADGTDRCAEAARRVLDLVAMTSQDPGDPTRRLDLLEGRLGVGVDPVG
jgi:hypothetical protein